MRAYMFTRLQIKQLLSLSLKSVHYYAYNHLKSTYKIHGYIFHKDSIDKHYLLHQFAH